VSNFLIIIVVLVTLGLEAYQISAEETLILVLHSK